MVPHTHGIAAAATDRQPLQHGRPFPRHERAPISAAGPRIVGHLLLILLVLRPRDVACVGAGNQGVPALARQHPEGGAALPVAARRALAKSVGAGVARIAQHVEGPTLKLIERTDVESPQTTEPPYKGDARPIRRYR